MPTDVLRAVDATLVLGVDDKNAPEGSAADAVISEHGLSNVVGQLTGVTVAVKSDVRPFYEIGRRYPTHLRSGTIDTSGTVSRAHINGAMLRLLLGDGATSPPGSANFVQPTFSIVASMANPAVPDATSKLVVFGVKFLTWDYAIPLDDFIMEHATFRALRIAFEQS